MARTYIQVVIRRAIRILQICLLTRRAAFFAARRTIACSKHNTGHHNNRTTVQRCRWTSRCSSNNSTQEDCDHTSEAGCAFVHTFPPYGARSCGVRMRIRTAYFSYAGAFVQLRFRIYVSYDVFVRLRVNTYVSYGCAFVQEAARRWPSITAQMRPSARGGRDQSARCHHRVPPSNSRRKRDAVTKALPDHRLKQHAVARRATCTPNRVIFECQT